MATYLVGNHADLFPPRAANLSGTPSNAEQHMTNIESALSDLRDAVNQLLTRAGNPLHAQVNFKIAANSALAGALHFA